MTKLQEQFIYILISVAIIFMIYNVYATIKESFCRCSACKMQENFTDYTGTKENTGYFDLNVKKCPHGIISYSLPGVITQQKNCL